MDYRQKISPMVKINHLYSLNEDDIWEMLDFSKAIILDGHFELLCKKHSELFFRFAAISQYPSYVAKISKELVEWVKQEKFLPSIDVVLGPTSHGMFFAYDIARELNGAAKNGVTRAVYATIDKETGCPQNELAKGFEIKPNENVLIVNDMTTTGNGLQTLIKLVGNAGGKVAGIGLFANRGINEELVKKLQKEYTSKFHSIIDLDMPAWGATDCKLCGINSPIVKSGEINHLPIYNDERSYHLYIKKLKKVA
ncbi:MAG: hypothetical protein HF982_06965 [Desulfobacteraceae bacterium]|nr:hypothetical protein [Desulfobacteraceae bacterium]MBC2719311.1 hypothetical protein [Desulfobacteraceae bacterium]